MKLFGWTLAVLLFAVPAYAQDCDNIVGDQGGAFKVGEAEQVRAAAQGLIDQGADVRVRTVGITANLDMDEKNFERSCQSWQSPNGGRKSTLVVLMVSPESRKMGIYAGSGFDHALKDHWMRIKQTYMAPHFKNAEWAAGFIVTEQQLAARIQASKDEAVHPAVSTTVNQATDLTGLWTVFKWVVFLGALALGAFLFITWLNRRRKAVQELREAQRKAIAVKAQAADLLNTKKSHPQLDAASGEFSRLNGSIRYDPYADNLAVEEYNVITAQYQKVVDMLTEPSRYRPSWTPPPSPSGPQYMRGSKHAKPHRPTAHDVAVSQNAAASTVAGYPIPVPIVEPVVIIEEEPRRRYRPDPEPEPERHRSSEDSGSGGSSSWSDSSSSSSDSGGSGGSSDFGGGGDSGGSGGSSDF